jgi:hypothetical protein
MRFLVETVTRTNVVVNAQSFPSETDAQLAAITLASDLATDNRTLRERYTMDCRQSVLEIDYPVNDSIPILFQYDYTYRVVPCHGTPHTCVACIEADCYAA